MTPMSNAWTGVNLLAEIIAEKTNGNPEHLTNFHAPLLALCLKAKRFEDALPYLSVDPLLLFDEKFEPVRKSGTRADVHSALQKKHQGGSFMQTFLDVSLPIILLIQLPLPTLNLSILRWWVGRSLRAVLRCQRRGLED